MVRRLALFLLGSLALGACSGSEPFDPAAETVAIQNAWESFFSEATPLDQRVALLEGGEKYRAAIEAQEETGAARGISAAVKTIALDPGESPAAATVTYDIVSGGAPLLPNSTGKAVKEAGTWKVSALTFCTLLELTGTKCPD